MQQYEVLDFPIIKEQVAAYAKFSLGKAHVLALEPHFKKLVLQRELTLMKESLQFCVQYGDIPFGGVYDISEALEKAAKGIMLVPEELKYVAMHCAAVAQLHDHFQDNHLPAGALHDLVSTLQAQSEIAKEIDRCIDETHYVVDDASATLKAIRRDIHALERTLQNLSQSLMQKHGASLQEHITAIRNDRLCLLVKISDKNKVKGIIHGESASGQAAYVEPFEIIESNNQLQTLRYDEHVEIEVILKKLSQRVGEKADLFLANLETLTLLDSLFARANYAKAKDGVVAQLNLQDKHLRIQKGRHPLIDPKKVVANHYEVGHDTHVLLISGPNTGGKTVTLKTIGLFVLMTYAGFPILCEEASIPLYDRLFVDIGDDQSIQQSLSTFSAHLAKLANITSHCTPNSLILLDELGSGTDPNEGEALAMAILDYLRSLNSRVIATTHYAKLKTYATHYDDIMLSCVEFDLETLTPTYRFLMNVSGQSNAFDIALRYGLPSQIVQAAREFKEKNKTDSERSMETLEKLIWENQTLKQELLEESEALAKAMAVAKNTEQKTQAEMQRLLAQAQEDANALIEQAQEEAQQVIDELKASAQAKPHELLQIKARLKEKTIATPSEPSVQKELAVGDWVLFKKYQYYGEITSINGKRVTLVANGTKMQTTLEELQWAQRPANQKKKRSKGEISSRFNTAFSTELNLLGYRVDEALAMVDKYLDNALYAKVFEVRIIHGVGTGALRKAVQEYLKTSRLVEDYRYGMQGEGGLGATVVKLKRKGK